MSPIELIVLHDDTLRIIYVLADERLAAQVHAARNLLGAGHLTAADVEAIGELLAGADDGPVRPEALAAARAEWATAVDRAGITPAERGPVMVCVFDPERDGVPG